MSRALIYRLNRLEIARHDQILGVCYAVSSQPATESDYNTAPSVPEHDREMTEAEWVRKHCWA